MSVYVMVFSLKRHCRFIAVFKFYFDFLIESTIPYRVRGGRRKAEEGEGDGERRGRKKGRGRKGKEGREALQCVSQQLYLPAFVEGGSLICVFEGKESQDCLG